MPKVKVGSKVIKLPYTKAGMKKAKELVKVAKKTAFKGKSKK